jgi:hypothetical protein
MMELSKTMAPMQRTASIEVGSATWRREAHEMAFALKSALALQTGPSTLSSPSSVPPRISYNVIDLVIRVEPSLDQLLCQKSVRSVT